MPLRAQKQRETAKNSEASRCYFDGAITGGRGFLRKTKLRSL
jgi:hypothetical protein